MYNVFLTDGVFLLVTWWLVVWTLQNLIDQEDILTHRSQQLGTVHKLRGCVLPTCHGRTLFTTLDSRTVDNTQKS